MTTTGIPAIELIDIRSDVEGARVLHGVNFGVEYGRVTALIGPSGAGKTTCLRTIVGLLWPTAGDVLVEGQSTLTMGRAERLSVSRRFGVLLQGAGVYGSALWDSITVHENLMQQLNAQTEGLSEEEMALRCQVRLAEVGLGDKADLYPPSLSAGQRRRLALARAMVADPPFVVLDSPELGNDPVTLSRLCSLIERRQEETGAAILVASQSMEVVRRLADDVVVLWNGRVIKEGPAEEVLETDEEEIRQLLDGTLTGPLTMAPVNPRSRKRREFSVTPGELGYEIPAPLAGFGLLIAMTASVLWLGGGKPVELVIVAAVWVIAVVLGLRWDTRRRAGG